MVRLLVTIAEATQSGLDLQELAGEAIAEFARYNAWLLTRKGIATDREVVTIIALADRCEADARAAWTEYIVELSKAAREDLCDVLRSVVERLQTARTTNAIDPEGLDIPEELLRDL
ncbi:MAG: hypothetical protein J2P15_08265 [Micromonosporaceae bacterium]|nr:hypothetical protein [Micromonosporaceae bacterium]